MMGILTDDQFIPYIGFHLKLRLGASRPWDSQTRLKTAALPVRVTFTMQSREEEIVDTRWPSFIMLFASCKR